MDYKIVVLGAAHVGKTCIINRFCNGVFNEKTLSTIGAGFYSHTVCINDFEVNLMIWDTAGEERFRSVAPSLLRGASGLILVYDITNPQSFKELDVYIQMFLDTFTTADTENLPVILLANKNDLEDDQIGEECLQSWKDSNHVKMFYKVSAKTGQNISDAFTTFAEFLVECRSGDTSSTLQFVVPKEPQKSSNCC